MRSVRSATCTLVFPVSRSLTPNLAAISRFLSVVNIIGGGYGSKDSNVGKDFTRQLDVAAHLLDQLLDGGEAPLAA